MSRNDNTLIIIGSGLAGYTVAREVRRHDPERPVEILTRDGGESYSKPLLSNALNKEKTPGEIPGATAEAMAEKLNARVRTRTEVTALDLEQHCLRVGGEDLSYGACVLALGADQIILPIEGNAADQVLSVNDLDDYARFRNRLAEGHRVVIIGGGLIGCEFANDLAASGHAVCVVDIASAPLSRLVPPETGEQIRNGLADAGVSWRFGAGVQAVEHDGGRLRCTLTDGTAEPADLVLSAVGLRARTGLASQAGLAVNRGICVDAHLRASAGNVYALGDCAEVEGRVLPYILPIMTCARALGATLCGQPSPVHYDVMPVLVKTPACPAVVAPPPEGAAGAWAFEKSEAGSRALFHDADGALLGFALTGDACAERGALTKSVQPQA